MIRITLFSALLASSAVSVAQTAVQVYHPALPAPSTYSAYGAYGGYYGGTTAAGSTPST